MSIDENQDERDELARTVKSTAKPKGTRIQKIRQVVAEHQAMRVDGVLLDSFTASMLVCILDALKEEQQAKFAAFPMRKMVDLGWKLYKKYGK